MSLIEVNDLHRHYGQVKALNGVSLNLEEGAQYAIQGSSGSGKSTLLYLLGGLDRPTAGEILIQGKNLSSLSDDGLAEYRNRWVGFVFQFHFLLPSMTGLENILLPARIGGHREPDIVKYAKKYSEELGVEHCLSKFPYELSGGEQQRINIIRALSLRPRLILCDEPTGNLDSENSTKVSLMLKRLALEQGSTLLVVSHDPNVVSMFDLVYRMKDGQFEI